MGMNYRYVAFPHAGWGIRGAEVYASLSGQDLETLVLYNAVT